jgi:D-glycero-alpha-D-manno-heptose 1-phosphate guanylyltransferase
MSGNQNLRNLTPVILVGGLGTRLRTVIPDRPKPLAEIHGRPFLAYLLDSLVEIGLIQVVLCTGYRSQQLRDALGTRYRILDIHYSHEPAPRGTAGAVRLALPFIQTEAMLIMNGDSYCQFDMGAFLAWRESRHADLALLLTHVNDVSHFGEVTVDETGAVTQFAEKQIRNVSPGWINAGVYIVSRNVIAELPEGQEISFEQEVFPARIGRGLYGFQGGGRFLDIGTPESYQFANQFFTPDSTL